MMRMALLFGLMLAMGCGKKPAPTPAKPAPAPQAPRAVPVTPPRTHPVEKPQVEPETTISGGALWLAFGQNETVADAKYKGKVLAVSGQVQGVFEDGSGYAIGMLVNPDESPTIGMGVVARFPASRRATDITALSVGQKIEVVGRCGGKHSAEGNANRPYVVILDGCTTLTEKPRQK